MHTTQAYIYQYRLLDGGYQMQKIFFNKFV